MAELLLIAAGLITLGWLANVPDLTDPRKTTPGRAVLFTAFQAFFVVITVLAAVHGVAAL